MGTETLTGKDTIKINDTVLVDFADGDVATVTYPNELVTVKTGKNKNSIFSINETGQQVDVELRVLLNSADDKFLNSLKILMENDLPAFTLLTGEFRKRTGDGAGNLNSSVYTLRGGVFTQGVDVKENVEGDTEQAIALYRLKFATGNKAIV